MNIFKVLASRKKFQEEQMSVLLGWLMHPTSEHGLGKLFLERFLVEAVGEDNTDIIKQLSKTPGDNIKCSLEESVSNERDVMLARIDIVFIIGDYVLAIENKIYDESVEENQLLREYSGLRVKYPDKKIVMTYLVPNISPMVRVEYRRLAKAIECSHMCALITWSDAISSIIGNILSEEAEGMLMQIPVQTKLTLESLNGFIEDGFDGYDFICNGGRNNAPSNFPRSTFAELKTKSQGFVGVALGATGLMKRSKEEILKKGFQYDDSLECNRQYWLPLKEFISLAEFRINGGGMPKNTRQRLKSVVIYKMTTENCNIYVGIQGGESGIMNLGRHEIDLKSWQVTTGEQPNSQWITGKRYKQIYESKFPERMQS